MAAWHADVRHAHQLPIEVEIAPHQVSKVLALESPDRSLGLAAHGDRPHELVRVAEVLRDDDADMPAIVRHKIGPRMVLDRELVLPISDIDNAFAAVRSRVGSRRSAGVEEEGGGGRRRKRKRGRR